MATDERVALAAQAFIYGFPLVFDLEQVGRFVRTGQLQGALTLTPTEGRSGRGLPQPDHSVAPDISFFERLRVWMQAFPPAQRDRAYQERFESLGLFEQESPYLDPDAGLLSALREA